MNYIPRAALILFVLAWCGIRANSAYATTVGVVFDNTARPSVIGVYGPSSCEVGNEITLGGNLRQITSLSWLVDSQNTNLRAEIDTQIYANDGPGGAPGTLLWSSGLLTGIYVSATDTRLSIAVPTITVPNVITVTSRFYDSSPVALGRDFGGSPTVGTLDASWEQATPGVWSQWGGPWAMRVSAIPEPLSVTLMAVAGVLLAGLSRMKEST